jgi:hypothetical protein
MRLHSYGRDEWRLVAKVVEKCAQQYCESLPLRTLEGSDHRGLGIEDCSQGVVGEFRAGRCEVHEYASTVSRVWPALDEPGLLEAIESDCHSSAGQKKILRKFGWAQGSDEVQLSKCLEISAMAEPVGGRYVVESGLDQVSGAKDSSSHLKGREIEVGPGCLPAGEHGVETVGHFLDSSMTVRM